MPAMNIDEPKTGRLVWKNGMNPRWSVSQRLVPWRWGWR